MPVAKNFYLIIALFACIIVCLFALDRLQAYMLDSVRAYVAAEGLWSKGQKDAIYHLVRYASSLDEQAYQSFEESLAVPLGVQQARLALQASPVDRDRARQGFLVGRNHPDDIDKLISLFLNFNYIPEMKEAIEIWTEADNHINTLQQLGNQLHTMVSTGEADPVFYVENIMVRIDSENIILSQLENAFSATLGNAARKVLSQTRVAMITATLLLLALGVFLSRKIMHGMRRTETALLDSEARFRRIVESNMLGILFWHRDGHIIDANDAFLDMLGYSREELEQEQLNWQALTPEEYEAIDQQAYDQLCTQGYCAPYEKEFLHKNGQRIAVLLGSTCFEHSKDTGVCFALDITERKQAEQIQRLSATVFNSAREAIIVTDSTPVIKAINPAFTQITGYEEDEVLGKNPSVLGSRHHDASFFRQMWKHLLSHDNWKGEVWNQRKNGEIYQEWLSISVIRDHKGEVSEYVGVFTDITEQRIMEEQLRQSQKMEAVGTLVGGIAHDFNNTLAAMKGNIYLAQKYNADNAKVAEKLESMDKLSKHSAEMVQHLLTFARKGIVQMSTLSLNVFFRSMERLTPTIIPESIHLDMQICEEELIIKGDSTQLHQVMLNLLNNARDAVADVEQPRIICSLMPYEADADFLQTHDTLEGEVFAHIQVHDNGCGISDGQLEHIFEPFYTTKAVGTGTGLGLAMVYGSMQTHQGMVDVHSKPGQGTSIHLYIPLKTAGDETVASRVKTKREGIPTKQQACILLVDDNIAIRNSYAEALSTIGYQVLTADDGIEALACYEEHRHEIDLLMTDIVMPRMGGFALAAEVRQLSPDLPVIFVTGYDPEQTSVPAPLLESSLILSKPFSIHALANQIIRMLKPDQDA